MKLKNNYVSGSLAETLYSAKKTADVLFGTSISGDAYIQANLTMRVRNYSDGTSNGSSYQSAQIFGLFTNGMIIGIYYVGTNTYIGTYIGFSNFKTYTGKALPLTIFNANAYGGSCILKADRFSLACGTSNGGYFSGDYELMPISFENG